MTSLSQEMAHMLSDIRDEVYATRNYIHREYLSSRVMNAMAQVPRHAFVPEAMRQLAYSNSPLPIGHGQTISQPYIVALMSDLLQTKEEDTLLEIGTGSGYQSAILSLLAKRVYSMEVLSSLSHIAAERLSKLGYSNILPLVGDGYLGLPEHAPYDGILVTAAAEQIPPALEQQLKPGARLVLPVGNQLMGQQLIVVEKGADGTLKRESILPVAFVPLVHG